MLGCTITITGRARGSVGRLGGGKNITATRSEEGAKKNAEGATVGGGHLSAGEFYERRACKG